MRPFKPRDDSKPNWGPHLMRVATCVPARGHRLDGVEPVALISLMLANQCMEPFALQLPQVIVLLRDLQRVLQRFQHEPDGLPLDSLEKCDLQLPPEQPDALADPKAAVPPVVKPSRRPDAPTRPISREETDAAHNLLENVKDHGQFMKLIGLDHTSDNQSPPSKAKPQNRCSKKKRRD